MKITECSQVERLQRALLACEVLTTMYTEGGVTAKQLAADIYYIAHSALCVCKNPHLSWLARIEEIEELGKKLNHYDFEKDLQGAREKVVE